jgi:hypothetical protein
MSGQPWLPIATAPRNTLGVAVYARMTCCGGGEGRVVMVAARDNGRWVYPNEHSFEFTHWTPLPPPPAEVLS